MRKDYHIKPVGPYAEKQKQLFRFRIVFYPGLKGEAEARATKKRYAMAGVKLDMEGMSGGCPFIVQRIRPPKRKRGVPVV
jgi:hypothetical protein